jgi:hypothetical protein
MIYASKSLHPDTNVIFSNQRLRSLKKMCNPTYRFKLLKAITDFVSSFYLK